MGDGEIDQQPEAQELVGALALAASAGAEARTETTTALRFYRRAFYVAMVAIVFGTAAIGWGAYEWHQLDQRLARHDALLECTANSERAVAQDVRVLRVNGLHAPTTKYPVPAQCYLPKK